MSSNTEQAQIRLNALYWLTRAFFDVIKFTIVAMLISQAYAAPSGQLIAVASVALVGAVAESYVGEIRVVHRIVLHGDAVEFRSLRSTRSLPVSGLVVRPARFDPGRNSIVWESGQSTVTTHSHFKNLTRFLINVDSLGGSVTF